MRHNITYRESIVWIAMIRENKDLAHETLHYKQRIHYIDCYDQKEQGPRT